MEGNGKWSNDYTIRLTRTGLATHTIEVLGPDGAVLNAIERVYFKRWLWLVQRAWEWITFRSRPARPA